MDVKKETIPEEKHDFIVLFGNIDDELIYFSGLPWEKRGFIQNTWKKVVCAALICIIALSCIFHTEVKAALNKVAETIGQILNIQEDISSYTDKLNTSVTKQGVTITLEEAVLGKNEMNISYLVNSEDSAYADSLLTCDAWINDQKITASEVFSSDDYEVGDPVRTVMSFRFDDSFVISDPIKVNLVFHRVDTETMKNIDDFDFSFTAKKSELKINTIEFSINESIAIGDNAYMELTDFSLNSMESTIKGSCPDFPYNTDYYLKGEDNLGNAVLYRLSTYSNPIVTFVQEKKESHISANAAYVKLQLYAEDYYESADDITEYDSSDITDESNTAKTNKNYSISPKGTPGEMYAVGEPFTINIKR